MSRYNHRHQLSRKETLCRIAFSLLAIAVLVIFMPDRDSHILRYNLNLPWEEEDLIAQKEFPIYKSETQIRHERDSIRQHYQPYYQLDHDVLRRQLDSLRKDIRALQMNSSQEAGYLYYYQKKLNAIYKGGILSDVQIDSLGQPLPRRIVIMDAGNSSSLRSLSDVLTEKEARDSAEKSSPYGFTSPQEIDLKKYISPNLAYNDEWSKRQRDTVNNNLTDTKGIVKEGEKIVGKGEIVNMEIVDKLTSFSRDMKENQQPDVQQSLLLYGGRILYASILVILLLFYLQQFRSDYLDRLRTVLLIMTHALLFPIITYLLVANEWTDVFLVPYSMLPIMLRISLDSRTAFVTHIITIMACAIVVEQPFAFVLTQTVAGLTAIYSLRELSQRYELFRSAILVTLSAMLTLLCLDLMKGAWDNYQMSNADALFSPYIHLIMAGVLTMLTYLLLIPLERLFGFTSIVTLIELQNAGSPLLGRLSEEASGTFNHSMQVANLAAEVANKIGAKAQLVRTGALYHDIGKLENPAFFTENQSGKNPHDGMTYERSAQVIIRHVEDGLRLASKNRLPQVVRDFIATHHGKSVTKYFYFKAKEAAPRGSTVGTAPFTYPGPKPQTLEQAILMMADSVEAASRSLPEYTEESISALVEKIVGSQVSEGSFDECPITLREITEAKEVLAARLRTIYHARIKYPEG